MEFSGRECRGIGFGWFQSFRWAILKNIHIRRLPFDTTRSRSILRHDLYDWTPEKCTTRLRNRYNQLSPSSVYPEKYAQGGLSGKHMPKALIFLRARISRKLESPNASHRDQASALPLRNYGVPKNLRNRLLLVAAKRQVEWKDWTTGDKEKSWQKYAGFARRFGRRRGV